ncbi:hypothetical protein ASG35_11880 [Burkholderia sp. Leaf177]|uniref:zinc ribbon domain-containing protein n=1 Tax=Burkholderia sp. Leaf177 TaxID=1736287 RepID=UPI0006FABAF2|nr:zinc ribbon domain-containing protein [Burkholderia sp. Leaf177]KQR76976.1 hypothetical protein ASG35_11880 [Burkholderia sp. Leaf177]
MATNSSPPDYLEAARSEDLKSQEVRDLGVVTAFERDIIDSLKGPGAHLLQGARGVGKTTLLRLAETEIDFDFAHSRVLAVYINFKTSTLLEGISAGQKNAFQIWVNTKILQSVHEKLVSFSLLSGKDTHDPYERVFGISGVEQTGTFLTTKLHQIQKLAFATDRAAVERELGEDFLDNLFDPSFLGSVLKEVTERFSLNRTVLLFDEAAHTFIPSQQEIFFELFKYLQGGQISCKAAVYPTVTSYGRNFEVGHDALILSMDRYEPAGTARRLYRQQFREIVDKRLPPHSKKRKEIFARGELLDLCVDISTGNPRAFLHILNEVIRTGFSARAISLAAQDYVDKELLPYHSNLEKRLPKYSSHVRVGMEMLRHYIIPEIRKKNRSETKSRYQAAAFTLPIRDVSPNLRLAIDILCYSGTLLSKGTVKIANQKTGQRYVVNIALLLSERVFSMGGLKENLDSISLTDYREFSASDANLDSYVTELNTSGENCVQCSTPLMPNAKFCAQCGCKVNDSISVISGLLEDGVDELSISPSMKKRIRPRFPKVGHVVQASREELMAIDYIKDVRSRIIKNAADEYISG